MSNHRAIVVDGVLIGREHWDVPVRVELRSFLRFNRRMDSQLRRLVVRWAQPRRPMPGVCRLPRNRRPRLSRRFRRTWPERGE